VKGRPRTPAVIKQLRGTIRKDRTNPDEPQPKPLETAEVPAWLDDYGRECWNAHVPHLLKNRLLTPLGTFLFAAVCERWSTFRRAVDEQRSGPTHETESNGTCAKPQVAIAKAAYNDFLKGLQEFGCTPATCGKVTAAKPDDDDDPLKRFLNERPRARRFLA
jgi:P27 family predicted phage terminase small subunit